MTQVSPQEAGIPAQRHEGAGGAREVEGRQGSLSVILLRDS